jgi:hypothetical protein
MMPIKRKEFERDLVTYDQADRPHILRVYVEILDASTFTEAKAEVKGMTILVSPDRRTVKRLGKGRYELLHPLEPTVIVTSDDPDAP